MSSYREELGHIRSWIIPEPERDFIGLLSSFHYKVTNCLLLDVAQGHPLITEVIRTRHMCSQSS